VPGAAPVEMDFRCPKCGRAVTVPDAAAASTLACPCGFAAPRHAAALGPDGVLVRCAACGDPRLYHQKDFSRAVGLGLLVGGFLLAVLLGVFTGPWGFFVVLGASAALDALLYALSGVVVVCHWCEAHYRGAPDERYPEFDLELHDVVRHEKEVVRQGQRAPAHEGEAGPKALHPTRYDG
jgi:hypothetical protein